MRRGRESWTPELAGSPRSHAQLPLFCSASATTAPMVTISHPSSLCWRSPPMGGVSRHPRPTWAACSSLPGCCFPRPWHVPYAAAWLFFLTWLLLLFFVILEAVFSQLSRLVFSSVTSSRQLVSFFPNLCPYFQDLCYYLTLKLCIITRDTWYQTLAHTASFLASWLTKARASHI